MPPDANPGRLLELPGAIGRPVPCMPLSNGTYLPPPDEKGHPR